ncbi:hypothetical protein NPIL_98421, partial [Nephila pilipes]
KRRLGRFSQKAFNPGCLLPTGRHGGLPIMYKLEDAMMVGTILLTTSADPDSIEDMPQIF